MMISSYLLSRPVVLLFTVAAVYAAPKDLTKKISYSKLEDSAPSFKSLGEGLNLVPQQSLFSQLSSAHSLDSFSPINSGGNGPKNLVDLQGLSSGNLPGVAPIPVPGFPGPQDVPAIPGVNTIPGLDQFNYLVGQLIPQAVPPANSLLGGSLARLLPQDSAQNLAKDVFRALHPPAAEIEVDRMMGRWFQVCVLYFFTTFLCDT